MTEREVYEYECGVIADFQTKYKFGWENFSLLGKLDDELYALNRFRWKTAVENKTDVEDKLREWTRKVAALIEHEEKIVLTALGNPPLRRSPKEISKAKSLYQKMTVTGNAPEELCSLALQLAGDGYASTAGMLLREAFQKEAPHRLDSAMTLLPTFVYIGYRYQKTEEFMRTLDQVTNGIAFHRKFRSSCDPVIHALCLSQLACALSERQERGRATELFFDASVSTLIDSTTDIPWPRSQLLRGRAAFHVVRCSELELAEKDLDRCKDWNVESNLRAMATMRHNVLAKRSQFKKAWDELRPFHKSGFDGLWAAMQKGQRDIRDLAHLFPSVYLGAMMRQLAEDISDKDAWAKDKVVLDWCYQRYGVMLMDDPNALLKKYPLPPELSMMRDKCMRKPLTSEQVALFDRLIAAVKEVPH